MRRSCLWCNDRGCKLDMPRGKYIRTKKVSEETRKKMSESKKRIGHRPPSSLGRKRSIETKMRLSEAKKGNTNWLGKKHTLETRKLLSVQRKGSLGSNWKGGVTEESNLIRHSLEYVLWRNAVFKRDNYTCIWCSVKNRKGLGKTIKINADHIKPFAHYPELRFAIDNGRTLCECCHKTTETYGGKSKKKMI